MKLALEQSLGLELVGEKREVVEELAEVVVKPVVGVGLKQGAVEDRPVVVLGAERGPRVEVAEVLPHLRKRAEHHPHPHPPEERHLLLQAEGKLLPLQRRGEAHPLHQRQRAVMKPLPRQRQRVEEKLLPHQPLRAERPPLRKQMEEAEGQPRRVEVDRPRLAKKLRHLPLMEEREPRHRLEGARPRRPMVEGHQHQQKGETR